MKALLLTLICLVCAAPAQATTLSQLSPDYRKAVELAHEHWHAGPTHCPQGITYLVQPMQGQRGSWVGCTLTLATGQYWLNLCTAAAHEWGHALQWPHIRSLPNDGHSLVPGDLMSSDPDPTAECLREYSRRIARGLRSEYRAKRSHCARRHGKRSRLRCVRRARASYRQAVRDFT